LAARLVARVGFQRLRGPSRTAFSRESTLQALLEDFFFALTEVLPFGGFSFVAIGVVLS
jgi:hypothetical protein